MFFSFKVRFVLAIRDSDSYVVSGFGFRISGFWCLVSSFVAFGFNCFSTAALEKVPITSHGKHRRPVGFQQVSKV